MADAAGVEAQAGRPVEVRPFPAPSFPRPALGERDDAGSLDRQREHALGREGGDARPGAAAVGRADHHRAVAQRGRRPDGAERIGGVDPARVRRVHRDRVDGDAAVARVGRVVAAEGLVRVVGAVMLDRVLRRVGPDHAPALARVLAAPEGAGAGVDHLRVPGVEAVGGDDVAEIEHAPGVAGVVGDVGAGHVAALDHEAGVVGADDGAQRRAPAAGAHHAPRVETRCRSGRRGHGDTSRHHDPRRSHARYSPFRSLMHSATATDCLASLRPGEGGRPAPSASRNATYSP